MIFIKTFLLFFVTAFFEILGCYLPLLIFKENKSYWLLLPTILSLSLFSYLLTLHPNASGRVYASYGGVYILTALLWLYFVDKISLSKYDLIGSFIAILGMFIIMFQPK